MSDDEDYYDAIYTSSYDENIYYSDTNSVYIKHMLSSSSDSSTNDSYESSEFDDDCPMTDNDMRLFRDLCQKYDMDYCGIIKSTYSCDHYKSLCSIVCPLCPENKNKYQCHNDTMMNIKFGDSIRGKKSVQTLNKSIGFANDNVLYHELLSTSITHIICIKCKHKQKFRKNCEKCKIRFARYICFKCKLMDNCNDPKNHYHCNDCDCCIIGKKRHFKHCNECMMCIQKNKFNKHVCKKDIWDGDRICSICQSSYKSQLLLILKCGHTIHKECYDAHIKSSYKCPECSKTIIDTTRIFSNIAKEIDNTPLHPELKKIVKIKCNDCNKINDVNFHYLGNRCVEPKCRSFNTYEI
jgi:RING finger and CHY zinc finger domain-containing protein 1